MKYVYSNVCRVLDLAIPVLDAAKCVVDIVSPFEKTFDFLLT